MIFARKVWKVLVAIKDGLALMLLLLFFMVLFAALWKYFGDDVMKFFGGQ